MDDCKRYFLWIIDILFLDFYGYGYFKIDLMIPVYQKKKKKNFYLLKVDYKWGKKRKKKI